MTNITGQCLCGHVGFEAHGEITRVTACHCQQCRRQNGGGAFHSLEIKGEVNLTRADGLVWYKSSDWAERGFCRDCGSSLFWKMQSENDHFDISIGALDSTDGIELQAHIFTDQCGSYENIPSDIPHMTQAEVMAAYNGSPS